MQRWPILRDGRKQWRLPLSGTVATKLCAALVDDPPERRRKLEEIIRSDPSCAVWVACAADDVSPRCVSDLATWFSSNHADVLDWPPDEPADWTDAAATVGTWTDLYRRSLLVARSAARLAQDPAQAELAYLLGLLHLTLRWIETSDGQSCSGTGSDRQHERPGLPGWLFEQLAWVDTSEDPGSAASLVRSAIQRQSSADDRDQQADREEIQQVDDAARRWADNLEAGRMLPTLVRKLNEARRLEKQYAETLQREKLAAMRELAYGASHEINNPLANIATRAQTLLLDETDPERRRKLAVINSQAFRAYEMISDLMLFAHPPRLELQQSDLVFAVKEALSEMADEAAQQGTSLEYDSNVPCLTVGMDRTQVQLSLRAMIRNSLEAVREDGRVKVSVALDAADRDQPDWAMITVRDSGPGLSVEASRHLFDPFYSGREAGRGLGFGLSKSWRIIQLHGGYIEVQSEPGRGAAFTIRLPIDASSDSGKSAVQQTANAVT